MRFNLQRLLRFAIATTIAMVVSAGRAGAPAQAGEKAFLLTPDGAVTDCRKPESTDNRRVKTYERQFTRFDVDECVWTTPINQVDKSQRAQLIRENDDLRCGIEEAAPVMPTAPSDEEIVAYLHNRGLQDVQLESSLLVSIDHKPMKRLSLRARDAKVGALQFLVWIWQGDSRLVTFTCEAPKEAMKRNVQAIEKVAASLRID